MNHRIIALIFNQCTETHSRYGYGNIFQVINAYLISPHEELLYQNISSNAGVNIHHNIQTENTIITPIMVVNRFAKKTLRINLSIFVGFIK